MEARDLTRPPGLQMHMQQIPAQPSMTAAQGGSLGAFYNHLRAGASSFPQQQLLQHQHPQAQQQQQQQRQQASSRNPLLPSMLHSPSAMHHSHSPNPSPTLNPNVYPPETPPHTIPHATTSPPSGIGVGMAAMNTGIMVSRSDPIKRKRGRPRKYTTDATGNLLPSGSTSPSAKKAGRASAKKTQPSTANGAAGQGLTPHVLTVSTGEDLTAKIMSFLQHGSRAVCILSANGAISNASLRHAGVSSSPVTYEGHFEVLTLSGLFLLSDIDGTQSRTGGLSVSLAGADGRVIGGKVAGLLLAASPVQVVLGTFFPHSRKPQVRPGSVEDKLLSSETKQEVLPPSVENDVTGSPPDQTSNSVDIPEKDSSCHLMPLQSAADWGGSHFDMETSGHNEQI